MTTKRALTVLGRTFLLTTLLILFIFGLEYFRSFGQETNSTVEMSQKLGEMIVVLSIISLSFFATNEWMRIKQKTQKIFPYFLWIILIPVLISIPIHIFLRLLDGRGSVFPSPLIILELSLVIGSFSLFLGLIHYVKYNIKLKNNIDNTIDWNIISIRKVIIPYALGLSIVYSLINFVAYIIYLPFRFSKLGSEFLFNFLYTIICWYLITFLHRYLAKKKTFLTSFILTIVGVVVIMQFVLILKGFVLSFLWGYLDVFFERFTFFNVIFGNIYDTLYLIFCALFFQLLYLSKTRTQEQKAFKAEIGKQTEKYESLRRQLSPHFLFNNINVLTGLIEENPKKAVHFSETLGNIYRHFLRQENEDVVSLQSALSFSKDYLELLKYRYEDAFQYSLPTNEIGNYYLIPLALQQVIENTIKHNEVSKETPLIVTITIANEYLVIENSKQLKSITASTQKTGIENIQKRYAFLTEKEVIIHDTKETFTIKLPLLNMENA